MFGFQGQQRNVEKKKTAKEQTKRAIIHPTPINLGFLTPPARWGVLNRGDVQRRAKRGPAGPGYGREEEWRKGIGED